MNGLALAWRLARRELRTGLAGFAVFLACLTLGVAAIAAVGVINAGVLAGLERDSAALLGGDIEVQSTNLGIEEAELAGLGLGQAQRSDVVRTNAMTYGAGERRVVAGLKAVDDAYPLYGQVLLDPPVPLHAALAGQGAAVERNLLARLDIGLGDRIRVGEAAFTVNAIIEREPDRIERLISLGPRVLISLADLPATEVIQPGSLARYEYRYALPPPVAGDAVRDRLRAAHPDARWRVQSVRDIQPRVIRTTDRLASYLTIAGLTALLIGGVGVALAIQNYLAGKTETIATLKCLGATSSLVFRLYLLQVLILAAFGVALGLTIGNALPVLAAYLTAGLLPVAIVAGFYPAPLAIAAGCGLLTAVTFAVWPLARAREVSPAGMFRALIEPGQRWPRPAILALLAASIAGLAALALIGVADQELAWIFIGVAAAGALGLAAMAQLLLRLVRRLGRRGNARLRLALANLHRPGAQAASVIVALGAGLAVLTMVAVIGRNLAAEVQMRLPERAPALFVIDIQRDQEARFTEVVNGIEGASLVQLAPVIRGRVVRIQDVPVAATDARHWSLRGDRGLSYVGAMPDSVELVAGSWWPADYQGPPLVSIEDDIAEAYGVGVGDRLTFNVLGRQIEATIASIRTEIDWSQARLDFVFTFSPGVLDAAPHTLAAAVDVPAAQEAALLDALADTLPNLTPVSIREVIARIGEVMGKVQLAIAVVAGVTLTSGVLVLAGAVAAARRRHRYEAVMLKVLGARRADLLQVFSIEYLGLGGAAALAGVVLGLAGAFAVVRFAMDLNWIWALDTVAWVAATALLLTLVAGFIGTWRLLGRPAAGVLRTA